MTDINAIKMREIIAMDADDTLQIGFPIRSDRDRGYVNPHFGFVNMQQPFGLRHYTQNVEEELSAESGLSG